MAGIIGYGRYSPGLPAADEDALTMMMAAAQQALQATGGHAGDRLALASMSLPYTRRVQAGLVAEVLKLPGATFCLECTTSARAGTEAVLALGTGLVAAADGGHAAALLLGEARPDGPKPLATIVAARSALAEYPGLDFTRAGETGVSDVQVPDYTEHAYLELVRTAAQGLGGDLLAINPPHPRLGKLAGQALGIRKTVLAPEGAGAAGPLLALLDALDQAAPGERVLLVSYGAGSAADALVVEKA